LLSLRGSLFFPVLASKPLSLRARSRLLLAYDARCGPCTLFKSLVSFLEPRGRVAYLSLEEAEHGGLLDSVPWHLRYSSAHLVLTDGEVLSGANALPGLLELLPGGRFTSRVVAMWSPGRRLAGFFYGVAVKMHDSGSCKK